MQELQSWSTRRGASCEHAARAVHALLPAAPRGHCAQHVPTRSAVGRTQRQPSKIWRGYPTQRERRMGICDPRLQPPGALRGPVPDHRKPAGNTRGQPELCSARHSAVLVGAVCGAPRSCQGPSYPQTSTPVDRHCGHSTALCAPWGAPCPTAPQAPRSQAGVRQGAKSSTQPQSCTQRSEHGFARRLVPGGARGSLAPSALCRRGNPEADRRTEHPQWSRGGRGRSALPAPPRGGSRTAPGGAAPPTRVGSAAQSTKRDRRGAPCGN